MPEDEPTDQITNEPVPTDQGSEEGPVGVRHASPDSDAALNDGPAPAAPEQQESPTAALETRIAELQQALEVAGLQLVEAQSQVEAARAEAEAHRAAAGETAAQALQAHRRALLAENAGQIVPELVQGATAEELETSVATAREAYQRILQAAQAQLAEVRAQAAAQVPVGASAAVVQTPEELSPMQKITQALTRNGR